MTTAPPGMRESDRIAKAFGQGSDARLAGLTLDANPYRYCYNRLIRAWRSGWYDVEDCWGYLVRGRWPIRQLPEVKYAQAPS
jgi:ribosome modulation factor